MRKVEWKVIAGDQDKQLNKEVVLYPNSAANQVYFEVNDPLENYSSTSTSYFIIFTAIDQLSSDKHGRQSIDLQGLMPGLDYFEAALSSGERSVLPLDIQR